MNATQQVLRHAREAAAWQEPLYRELHADPELSMVETRTVARISTLLNEYGYDVHELGGGLVGVLTNGAGPTVLLRADIDALPVAEQTGLPYASTKTMADASGDEQPVMHACGHDVHITAGLGAAALLAQNQDAWSGTYLALFQPGEETAEGARSMVDAGLTDRVPTPDVALAQHVLGNPEAGSVCITEGPALSTAVSCEVTIHGKGSHGSMPHIGVDPVVTAAAIILRLQTIVAREIAPGEFGVVTVGSVRSGNKANIIPATATLRINFRAYSEEVRDTLTAAMERIVRAECEGARCPKEPEFTYSDRYPLTDNDPEVTATVRAAFEENLGAHRVQTMTPATASEDFSYLPDAFGTPYCYWGLGGFTAGQEVFPNHNPKFAPAIQPTLTTGTEAALTAALAFLGR